MTFRAVVRDEYGGTALGEGHETLDRIGRGHVLLEQDPFAAVAHRPGEAGGRFRSWSSPSPSPSRLRVASRLTTCSTAASSCSGGAAQLARPQVAGLFAGLEQVGRQEQVGWRGRAGKAASEAHRGAGRRGQAVLQVPVANPRGGGGDHHVAGQQELAPAGPPRGLRLPRRRGTVRSPACRVPRPGRP